MNLIKNILFLFFFFFIINCGSDCFDSGISQKWDHLPIIIHTINEDEINCIEKMNELLAYQAFIISDRDGAPIEYDDSLSCLGIASTWSASNGIIYRAKIVLKRYNENVLVHELGHVLGHSFHTNDGIMYCKSVADILLTEGMMSELKDWFYWQYEDEINGKEIEEIEMLSLERNTYE